MGHAEIDQTLAQAGDTHTTPAMMQVIIDAHGKPGDKTAPTGTLISTNIENRGSSDDQSLNQFPNGVKFGTAAGVLSIEAPPGGKVIDKGGVAFGKSVGLVGPGMGEETLVYDAHKHLVAQFDKNKVMHVHTKNGEYTETLDGQVTFKPATGISDLSTLHHSGIVTPAKFENYSISTSGHTTRFGNGIEYDASTGHIKIPSEYPNFSEEKKYDDKDHLIARVGTDGDGKVLYTLDRTGMNVPTHDGTLSQKGNGTIRFDRAAKPSNSLPHLTLTDTNRGS